MHIAIETLALELEAFEDALRDLQALVVVGRRLRLDTGAQQIGSTGLDVLDDELQLLESPVCRLRALLGLAILGPT